MAYEHERDEWRTAVRTLTEAQRYININASRWARGIDGDTTDMTCPGCQPCDDDGDDAA